jgi:hypothetical protein
MIQRAFQIKGKDAFEAEKCAEVTFSNLCGKLLEMR